ncbi:RidA family protein [Ferrovibrio terrae]|uniref:RidA family protein n=1 Tax=Ferrovibrio terrae TaxID=2594003 RepID=UPI003137870E
MFTLHNPSDAAPLPGPISWGLELPTPRRLLYVSGQVGEDATGRIGDGILRQAELTWANVGTVLRAAGMTPQNILRTGIYFTSAVDMTDTLKDQLNKIRVGFLGGHRPASTILFVPRLMNPAWLIEIDAIAAEV